MFTKIRAALGSEAARREQEERVAEANALAPLMELAYKGVADVHIER